MSQLQHLLDTGTPHPRNRHLKVCFCCFSRSGICFYGACCTPCLYGENVDKLEGGGCAGPCLSYYCLSLVGSLVPFMCLQGLVAGPNRKKICECSYSVPSSGRLVVPLMHALCSTVLCGREHGKGLAWQSDFSVQGAMIHSERHTLIPAGAYC